MKKLLFLLLFFTAFHVQAQRVHCFGGAVSVDSLWTLVEKTESTCKFLVSRDRNATVFAEIRKYPTIQPNRLILISRALEQVRATTPVVDGIHNERFGTETRPNFTEQFGFFLFTTAVSGEPLTSLSVYKHISAISKPTETQSQYYFEMSVLHRGTYENAKTVYRNHQARISAFKGSLAIRPVLVVNPGVVTDEIREGLRDAARPALPNGVNVSRKKF
ncbi:MAG: hypothetical protein J0L94_16130 [Rhodothermia bacterium]|nr:hypothetical protein [Rhodothermia bacterium]